MAIRLTVEKEEREQVGLIQGRTPGSIYEWRVAVSLMKLGWTFGYQVNFFGGRSLRGGMVIDFLVDTLPLSTPTFVQGEYWHNPKSDRDALQRVLLTGALHGQVAQPVFLWGPELHTQQSTDALVMRTFGRAK